MIDAFFPQNSTLLLILGTKHKFKGLVPELPVLKGGIAVLIEHDQHKSIKKPNQ
tara:strand:+ start:20 stop:181 length:162 start_codon:yes stop_codon:yes gene_type:complete